MTTRADRILLVLPSLERGGGELVLLRLAQSFLAAGRDVHLAVLHGGGPLRLVVPEAVTVYELINDRDLLNGAALARRAFPKLVSLIRAIRPDAVLSTMTGTNLLVVLACMLAHANARLVLREASSLRNARGLLKRLAMRLLYRRADKLIAVSRGVSQDLRGLGLRDDRIHVIRNPVDVERLRQLAATGLPPEVLNRVPYIVSLGRLTKAKDFPCLLRAYAMSTLRSSHQLIIVGEGEQRTSLEKLVRDLGLGDRVIFMGAMNNPHGVVAGAALYVLSSRWEGYPNALLEALALGVPIVSTDCPHGPREILDSGRYGRLVPVGEAASLAKAMDAELERRSSNGESVLATHVPRAVAARYLELLDDACKRGLS